VSYRPLFSGKGTYKTVKARFSLVFQVKVLKTFGVVPSSLGSGLAGSADGPGLLRSAHPGFGFRDAGFGFGDSGFGIRVSGFESQVSGSG